jgi:hypothetical protein
MQSLNVRSFRTKRPRNRRMTDCVLKRRKVRSPLQAASHLSQSDMARDDQSMSRTRGSPYDKVEVARPTGFRTCDLCLRRAALIFLPIVVAERHGRAVALGRAAGFAQSRPDRNRSTLASLRGSWRVGRLTCVRPGDKSGRASTVHNIGPRATFPELVGRRTRAITSGGRSFPFINGAAQESSDVRRCYLLSLEK